MPNRYYPKNQRFYGKYTKGGEYMNASDTEYIGPYHYFGNRELVMTGAFPKDDSMVLMPFKRSGAKTPDVFFYDFLTSLNLAEFKTPVSKRPKPGPNDLKNGYMLRYFLKLKNDVSAPVFEIDMPQYDDTIDNDANNIDGFRYQRLSLRWKIDGPRYDEFHDDGRTNVKAYGIEDTNRRTVFAKNQEIIKNMIKVANLTRSGFANGDISTLMSPRTVISWGQNFKIFKDIVSSFELTFLNKCDEVERTIISEYFQRCFDIDIDNSVTDA